MFYTFVNPVVETRLFAFGELQKFIKISSFTTGPICVKQKMFTKKKRRGCLVTNTLLNKNYSTLHCRCGLRRLWLTASPRYNIIKNVCRCYWIYRSWRSWLLWLIYSQHNQSSDNSTANARQNQQPPRNFSLWPYWSSWSASALWPTRSLSSAWSNRSAQLNWPIKSNLFMLLQTRRWRSFCHSNRGKN